MISTLKPALARLRPAGNGPLLPPGFFKSLAPLVAFAAGITALVLMFMWRDEASYKPVFGAHQTVAVADMMSVLDGAAVPYRIHPESGQILVPEERLGEIRMLLASKGVVAKLPAGLELMDRNDPLGVSQFVQDIRFRRGLEGELAQSIATLDAVDSARVHLSIAKSASFVVSGNEKSTASVVLTLKPGRHLDNEQIAAIINLVANSVASMDPQRVSVVDQAGELLSARVDPSDGMAVDAGAEAARRYQEETRQNVRDLLAPMLGPDNYRLSVTAEVDNDRIQETRERYGETPKVTSEAMRTESGRDPIGLGVPGSLSNRPIAVSGAASTEKGTQTGNAAPPQKEDSKEATTRQYAYDRTVTQVQRSRGRLRRLNVAVVLNSAAAPSGNGKWSDAELADVARVLKSGLGIDATRGDTLEVSTFRFPDKAVPPPVPWWQQRDNVIEGVSWTLYALGALFAYLLVLRPLVKAVQRRAAAPAGLPPVVVDEDAAELEALPEAPPVDAGHTLPPPGRTGAYTPVTSLLEDYDLPPPGSPVDVMVEHLKGLAAKEPERVAEVVKQWVQKHGRSE